MRRIIKYKILLNISVVLFWFCVVVWSEKSTMISLESDGVEVECGHNKIKITVKRPILRKRHFSFTPEFLRLGKNSKQISCGPEKTSETEMVISSGFQDCETESRIDGDWLVYSNQLFLLPAVIPTSRGSVIVRGVTTVIPIECYYERKQKVTGQPLKPTWVPMTSTVGGFGLLQFHLRLMADGCSSPSSSLMYHQGAAVFLEASVEAPLHPSLSLFVDYCVATLNPDPLSVPSYKFIDKHGCHMDSLLPGSSSRFLPREINNKQCFSFQAFHFNQLLREQMYVSCHLKVTLKQKSHSFLDKACFFHRPSFRWQAIEGDNALCECCDFDCWGFTEMKKNGDAARSGTGEGDTTVGPIQTIPNSYWTGRLSLGP